MNQRSDRQSINRGILARYMHALFVFSFLEEAAHAISNQVTGTVVKSTFFFPRTLLPLQFQVHSGWPRARVFLEPSTRGRALQLERTCARSRRRHSESWYAGTFSLVGGLHGPDTINVLRPTSRTKTRGDARGGPEGEE